MKGTIARAEANNRSGEPSGAVHSTAAANKKELARTRKLQDVPKRFHQLYRQAWGGKWRKSAIRAFCVECVCYESREVIRCTSPTCPLYEFRLRG